ncbi:hypothetical protein DVH05_012643 [Phytophthora capsici]|nr:hypothetical protein DVH05_012643 [Phytophthora capsici]
MALMAALFSSGSAALPIKRAMRAAALTREEKLVLLREYSNRKRVKERSYREILKNQIRIRYYRSRGYNEDDANDDDTESKTGGITEQHNEESAEGGVEVDLEAKNDDDVEQRRGACNENIEESIEGGDEGDLKAKNVEQEEIEWPPTLRYTGTFPLRNSRFRIVSRAGTLMKTTSLRCACLKRQMEVDLE